MTNYIKISLLALIIAVVFTIAWGCIEISQGRGNKLVPEWLPITLVILATNVIIAFIIDKFIDND
jgi:hypothetical protein